MKNLFLNIAFAALALFGLSNCEKPETDNSDQRTQWGNCDGRWSSTALDCSGAGSCCLEEVEVVGIVNKEIIDDLGNNGTGIEGIVNLVEIFQKDEARKLFTSLNDKQIELLTSGDYAITRLILEPEVYADRGTGTVKFFAATKELVKAEGDDLENYDFNFTANIRE